LLDQELCELFFPNAIPIPKECALWDYKESFSEDKLAYAELVKDILSFFNSYGGYLFFGISEQQEGEPFRVVGFQRSRDFLATVRAAIESYASAKIDVAISDIAVSSKTITAIFIPCRPTSQAPTFLTKNGPDKKPGRPLFTERTTYFRQHDSALPATIASQWEFLNSARNPDSLLAEGVSLSQTATISRVIPNNLPDRNLICSQLFGREDSRRIRASTATCRIWRHRKDIYSLRIRKPLFSQCTFAICTGSMGIR
jgi:hypothetical protein